MHGEPENDPAPLLAKLTMPFGDVGPIGAVSLTTTVHVVAWLIRTEDGAHVTDALVESLPKPIDVDP